MRFEDWEPHYQKILAEFGFDAGSDIRSANMLARRIQHLGADTEAVWSAAGRLLTGAEVVVVGAADDAGERVAEARGSATIVAADGATTACLQQGIVPDIIVTDLDGNMPHEVAAAAEGSRVLVHAHGDNMEAIGQWLGRLEPSAVAGTCQSRPVAPLRNYGGFTDGDRACFIAHALGARRITLVGFAFEGPPGRYAGSYDPRTKSKKLWWARRLIDELRNRGAVIETL